MCQNSLLYSKECIWQPFISIICSILDGSIFWLFLRVWPGVSKVKFEEFDRHLGVIGHISLYAQPLCWVTPCLESTAAFYRCLIAAFFWPSLTFQLTCQSSSLLQFGAFSEKWHNLCLNHITWTDYLPLYVTDFCRSTIDQKSYSWVPHSKIKHPKAFSPMKFNQYRPAEFIK